MIASRIAAAMFFLLAWSMVFEDLLLPREIVTSTGYHSLTAILSVAIIFLWFILDSRARKIPTSSALKAAVIVVPFIGVPYYKFKYFGWKDGFKFLTIFLTLLLLPPVLLALALNYGLRWE